MKMHPGDYNYLKHCLNIALGKSPHRTFGDAAKEYSAKGLTAMRCRWDLLWSSDIATNDFLPAVYGYCNDSHIDTALKAITEIR